MREERSWKHGYAVWVLLGGEPVTLYTVYEKRETKLSTVLSKVPYRLKTIMSDLLARKKYRQIIRFSWDTSGDMVVSFVDTGDDGVATTTEVVQALGRDNGGASTRHPVELDKEVRRAMKKSSYQEAVASLDAILQASAFAHQQWDEEDDGDIENKRMLFHADVNELRKRMREARVGFINPRAWYVQAWDLVTTLAIIFTAIVTPFEIGLNISSELNALFAVNQLVNAIFIVDMAIQFVLPVPDVRTGELIRSHKRLAVLYLRSWFLLDLVSVLPLDTVATASPSLFPSDNSSTLRGIKLLRVMRLIKLVRVLRASRLITRWENRISLSTSVRSILAAWFGFCVCLHWLACLWSLTTQILPSWREWGNTLSPPLAQQMVARIEQGEQCTACDGIKGLSSSDGDEASVWECAAACLTPCEMSQVATITHQPVEYIALTEPWTCRAAQRGLLPVNFADDPFQVWLASLVVAMFQLLGGTGTIQPTNRVENGVFFCGILAGTMIFAMIQGIIIQVLTTGNPDETDFRQKLDALNFMLSDNHIESEMRERVRDYFRRSKRTRKRHSYVDLINDTLSHELRGDMQYLITRSLFDGVWYLAACERSFLEDLSVFVRHEGFAPGERIESCDSLAVLVQGVCSRGGVIMTRGSFWGDAIITSPVLRDTRDAKALAYCGIARISRAAIFECVTPYPKSAAYLRWAGLMLATKRTLSLIHMIARIEGAKQSRDTDHSHVQSPGNMNSLKSFKRAKNDERRQLNFASTMDPTNVQSTPAEILHAMHQADALQLGRTAEAKEGAAYVHWRDPSALEAEREHNAISSENDPDTNRGNSHQRDGKQRVDSNDSTAHEMAKLAARVDTQMDQMRRFLEREFDNLKKSRRSSRFTRSSSMGPPPKHTEDNSASLEHTNTQIPAEEAAPMSQASKEAPGRTVLGLASLQDRAPAVAHGEHTHVSHNFVNFLNSLQA